ncbi:MAG TPA: hypothetical protein VFX84_03655 [Candidatus Saccharimonadales bacterium]|nr:hypothetical protein [Candidatus Saccharimonadales bacterium]
MFGHQDDNKDHKSKDEPKQETDAPAVPEPAGDQPDPGNDGQQPDAQGAPDAPASDGQQAEPVDDEHAWQHQGEPADDQQAEVPAPEEHADNEPEPISDIIGPAGGVQNPAPPMPINARDLPDDGPKVPHELIDIKQKALTELKPMLGQLDLSPEDKFRTLMMIIQASDNQEMIKQAYDVAEDIKDEKARAQALLDIVNEINYFTQHPAS